MPKYFFYSDIQIIEKLEQKRFELEEEISFLEDDIDELDEEYNDLED